MVACFLGYFVIVFCFIFFCPLLWAHVSWSFIWETLCPGFKVLSFGKFIYFLFTDASGTTLNSQLGILMAYTECTCPSSTRRLAYDLELALGNFCFSIHDYPGRVSYIPPEGRHEVLRKWRSYSYSYKKKKLACVHRFVRLRNLCFSLIPNVIKWLYCVDVWTCLKPALSWANRRAFRKLVMSTCQRGLGNGTPHGEFTMKCLVVAVCCYWLDMVYSHQMRGKYIYTIYICYLHLFPIPK